MAVKSEPSNPTMESANTISDLCPTCGGAGHVQPPELHSSLSELARQAGVSPALLSRMFSDNPEQKRGNPSLTTMRRICEAIEGQTGVKFSLDQLAAAIKN